MGYYSSDEYYSSDDNDDAFNVGDVQCIAREYGYTQCQHERREGVLDFRRADADGDSEIVRVWYRTGTVGTYIKHPTQQRTQLFRRDNTQISQLRAIFNNPRVHTGRGYHRRGDRKTHGDRNTPCPSCGRMHRGKLVPPRASRLSPRLRPTLNVSSTRSHADLTFTRSGMIGAVQHFESGSCPNCPNREDACRAVHGIVNRVGSHMVVQQIGWDGESGASYDPDGLNYRCPCCDRQTRTMQALMQHMNARPQCRSGASSITPSLAQLAY